MTSRVKKLALTAVLALAAGVSTGCAGGGISPRSLYADMEPEMHSVAYTTGQRDISYYRSIDYYHRGVWDDMNQVLLVDRPTRLTRYPVPFGP